MPSAANFESPPVMTNNNSQDPAAIESEIRDTQDNMSSTIDKIGDQLSIKNMFNAILAKADESNVDTRMILDGARRNPVALALIAAGAIWLVSDKDSKIPSLNFRSGDRDNEEDDASPYYQNDYVSHMSAVEQRADEDIAAYQRRRDLARSNFFMLERGHEEEESAFRLRLDVMTDAFRKKRHDFADRSNEMVEHAQKNAVAATYKVSDAFANNPLVSGIVAAALGAAIGSALPGTRQEKDRLGKIGGQLRDTVAAKSEDAASMLRGKKDELLEKADDVLKPSDSQKDSNTIPSFNAERTS